MSRHSSTISHLLEVVARVLWNGRSSRIRVGSLEHEYRCGFRKHTVTVFFEDHILSVKHKLEGYFLFVCAIRTSKSMSVIVLVNSGRCL